MKVIIIGNNVSGTFTAQNIRQQNKDVEIQIFTKEKYPYYTRVYLPQVISGKMTIEKLIVFKEDVGELVNLKGDKIGPFEKGQIANISKEIAQILIDDDKAELVLE